MPENKTAYITGGGLYEKKPFVSNHDKILLPEKYQNDQDKPRFRILIRKIPFHHISQ